MCGYQDVNYLLGDWEVALERLADAGALYHYALATATKISAEGMHVRRIQEAIDRLSQKIGDAPPVN